MPLPPEISQQPYNWWTSRDGHAVVAIGAHNTVGWNSRAYLSRGGDLPDGSDKKVSIHYLIAKSGAIDKFVSEERGANQAGFGTMPVGFPQVNPNKVLIGFELENASNGKIGPARVVDPYPDEQLLAMGWLILDIRRRHGPLPILLHRTLDPNRRSDPVGLDVATIEHWVQRAQAALAATAPDPAEQRWALWGTTYPLDRAARVFSIPQQWYRNVDRLGEATGPAFYPGSGLVFQTFRGGFIWGPAAGGPLDQYKVVLV